MRAFPRPVIVVSKCLGFAACRYNGQILPDDFVDKLRPYVDFRPVCAEVEIGLGVPRDPVRVTLVESRPRLLQPATGRDVTDAMHSFVDQFLGDLPDVDGFILKSRSPSCGIKDVKIYSGAGTAPASQRGAGFFGGPVIERFGHLAVEDEGRLTNFRLREHFLTQTFTFASFRHTIASGAMKELVRFHSENKYLLMGYNQSQLRVLGRIVANHEKRPFAEVIPEYQRHLFAALGRPPRCDSAINVLQHIMGYASDELSTKEKAFFLEMLEQYREKRIPLSASVGVARSWVVRFEQDYLSQQTFFEPFPEALVEVTDSGKGRAC